MNVAAKCRGLEKGLVFSRCQAVNARSGATLLTPIYLRLCLLLFLRLFVWVLFLEWIAVSTFREFRQVTALFNPMTNGTLNALERKPGFRCHVLQQESPQSEN